LGMRVAVWDRGRYRHVTTLPDTGPIAWNDLAIPLPKMKGETVKVRLSFVADNWRIDQVALGAMVRTGKARKIPVTEVHSASGAEHRQAQSSLHAADDAYLVTKPGEYLRLRFDVGHAEHDLQRTWFLAAEGYYIEWMRKEWLEKTSSTSFVPNDDTLLTAIGLWESQRDELREQFEATRIRVR